MIFLNKVLSLSLLICFIFTTPVYSHKIKSDHKLRAPLISSKKDEVEHEVALWVKVNCQSLRKEGVEVTPVAEYFLEALFMNRNVIEVCDSLLNHCILKKTVLRILQKSADTPSGMTDVDGIAKSALVVVSNPEQADVYLKEHYPVEKLNLTDSFTMSLFIPTKKLSMSSEELLSQARENFFIAVGGVDDLSKIISQCLEPMILARRYESSDGTEYLCKFYYSPDENKLSGLLFIEGGRVLVQEIDFRLKTLKRLEGTFEKGEAFFDLHGIEVSRVCQAIGYIRNVCFLVGLDFVINIEPTLSYRFLRESLKDPRKGQICVKDYQTASDGSRVSSLLFPWIFNPLFKGCLSLQGLVMSDNGIYERGAGQSLFVGLETQDERILKMSDEHILREYIDLASMIQGIRKYLAPIASYQAGEAVYLTLWDVGPDYGLVPTATAQQIIAATSIMIKKGYGGYSLRRRPGGLYIEVNNRTLMREMSHHVSTLVRKMDKYLEIQSTSGTGLYCGWSEIIDRMFDVFEQAGSKSMPPYQSWRTLFEYEFPYKSGHKVIENLIRKLVEKLIIVNPSGYKGHDWLLDTEMPLHPSRIYDSEVPLPDSFVATARRVIEIKPRQVPGAWVYGKMAFKEEIGQAYIDTMSQIGVRDATIPFLSITRQLEVMMKYGWNEFEGVDVPAEQQKEFFEYKKSVLDEIQSLEEEIMKAILDEQSLSGFALILKAKFPDQVETIDKWSTTLDRIKQLERMVSDNLFKNLGLKYLDLLGCKEQMRNIMTDYFSLYACASLPEYKIPLSRKDAYDEIISGTSTRLSSEMKKSPLVYVGCDGSKEPTMLAWLENSNVLEKIVTGEIIVVNGMLQLRERMLTLEANYKHDI